MAVNLGNRVAVFSQDKAPLTSRVVKSLVAERAKYKKSDKHYANALKVMCNSLYGALGYEHSPLYSPSCSASVTAVGRWCLVSTSVVLEGCGLQVVYGDTNSCFVTSKRPLGSDPVGEVTSMCTTALSILKRVFSHTPLGTMNMELEAIYRRVLLIQKNYVCTDVSGNMKFKGVSVVRGDTLGICRETSSMILSTMLTCTSRVECRRAMAHEVAVSLDRCALGILQLKDVSRIMKIDGSSCYVYVAADGSTVTLPMDKSSPGDVVPYSKFEVGKRIRKDFERYTVAGYGLIGDVIQHCPISSSSGIDLRPADYRQSL